MYIKFSIFLVWIICLSCNSQIDSENMLHADLLEWRNWFEASSHLEKQADLPIYVPADTLLTPEGSEFSYFMIESFVIHDEKIFLSDGRSSTVLAFTMDGDLLWKVGGVGEGPGLFTGLGEIACSGDTIAVCNHGVGRVDLFNSDTGVWLSSISVLWPYDICFHTNGNLVVISSLEASLVTVFSPSGEKLSSFGQWDPPGVDIMRGLNASGNRNFHSVLLNDSILAVNSYFFNWCQLYNINKGELLISFRRDLPYPEVGVSIDSNVMIGKIYTNDIASFNNQVVVLNRPVESSWEIPSRYANVPFYEVDYSFLDVYTAAGEYTGSFALNRCVGKINWYNGILYGATDETGELIQYREVLLNEILKDD